MKSVALIALLVLSASAATASYTMPNLHLDSTSPTCSNVNTLLVTYTNDYNRVKDAYYNRSPHNIKLTTTISEQVEIACDLSYHLKVTYAFVELNKKAKNTHKSANTHTKVAKAHAQIKASLKEFTDPVDVAFEKRFDKIESTFNMLLKSTDSSTNSRATHSSLSKTTHLAPIKAYCTDLHAALADMKAYLEFVKSGLGTTLTLDLPQRKSVLNAKKTACAKPAGCNIDEAKNARGKNRCWKSSECAGNRTCSNYGWCRGNSGC